MSKVLNSLFRGVEILMAAFLAVMILLVFLNVILRFVFSTGFAWSEEITRLCFIYLVYLGTIGAARDNRHLGVETVLERVPPLYQKIIYVFLQLSMIWLMWILTQGSWELARQNLDNRWVATQFPSFLVSGIGVITGVSIIMIGLANLFRLFVLRISVPELVKIVDGSDSNEPEFSLE